MTITARIIERDTIPRYQAPLNTVIPMIGSIWYDPKKQYALELSDGVVKFKEQIAKGKVSTRFQGHNVTLVIEQKPNAKGMYDFKLTAEKNLTTPRQEVKIEPVSQRDSLGANSDLAKNANKSKEA